MVKKNYHGGLKVLLLLLFGILFAMPSTCFANVSEEYVTYLMESIRDDGTFLNNSTTNKTYVSNFLNNTDNITTLTNQLNNRLATHNWSNLTDYNLFATFQTSSNNIKIKFCFSNCTFPNGVTDVGYTQFRGNYFGPYNSENNLIVYLTLNNSASYSEYFTTGTSEYYDYIDRHVNSDYTTVYFDNVYNYIPTQSIYIANAYNQLAGALLNDTRGTFQNNLPVEPEPEEPSGDSPSGDSGDSGGNNPGFIDYTNKLNDINNNISNSSNNIIQNSNENTDKIINSISGETNKIINNITNTDTDVNVSGELSNMLSSTDNIVDPTINFFSWLLDNIRSVLNSTGDYDLNITLFDKTYTIRSDFFKLPDGDLKTFLQSAFLAWFGWRIIKKIRYIVYAIKCVNISSALNSVDFNPNIL